MNAFSGMQQPDYPLKTFIDVVTYQPFRSIAGITESVGRSEALGTIVHHPVFVRYNFDTVTYSRLRLDPSIRAPELLVWTYCSRELQERYNG